MQRANCIVPNLFISRILDKSDSQNRLHHGYSILFINTDIESAVGDDQPAKAFVVDETHVLIEIPSSSTSLLQHFASIEPQLERNQRGGEYDEPLSKSHNTLVDQLSSSSRLRKFRILIEFCNGEELTNIPFSGTDTRFGEIPQLPRATNRTVDFAGMQIPLAEMYTMFQFARLERETRKLKTNTQTKTNLAAEDLTDMLAGMRV